jgi:hypothetical protein
MEELSGPKQKEVIGRILRVAHPEIKSMLRAAHDQGFVVSKTRNGHYKIETPPHWREKDSRFAPGTPSDTRGLHRVRAKLRRLGVELP